jgi:DNA-binding MarR family transcriptional regulator
VVDDPVGPVGDEALGALAVAGGSDVGPGLLGELDRGTAHRAAGAVDEDRLSLLETGVLEQCLPGRECDGGQGGGRGEVDRARRGGHHLHGCEHVLGGRAVGADRQESYDGVADLVARHVWAELGDGAGEVGARHDRERQGEHVRQVPGTDHRVDGVERAAGHFHQHLARARDRPVDLLDCQDVAVAVLVVSDCFHDYLPSVRSGLLRYRSIFNLYCFDIETPWIATVRAVTLLRYRSNYYGGMPDELDPAHDTAPQRETFFALMESVSLLQHAIERNLRAEGDLSYVQFQLLCKLAAAPRKLTMTELADGVVLSRSGLSHQACLLSDAGLIERTPDPDDHRSTLVGLTDAGRARFDAVLPSHIAVARELLYEPLDTEDVKRLGDIITRVRDHIRAKPPRSANTKRRITKRDAA